MKKTSIVIAFCVFCLCVTKTSFAIWASHPKIDEKHIAKDLIGRQVQGWTFEKAAPCRLKILDAKYDKDTAIVYIFVKTIDFRGKYGREGKLRLEYEYAADDWNILDIKPISFSRLENDIVYKMEATNFYPLLAAADEGNVDRVRSLIAEGADVNATTGSGPTALILAVEGGYLDVAKILLSKGADVNAKDNSGQTALIYAAKKGHLDILQQLLERGADLNVRDKDGNTALGLAVGLGHTGVVQALVDKGADVNGEQGNYWLPLAIAAEEGHTDIVQMLLSKGATVNAKDAYGWTALCWAVAVFEGHTDVVKALIAANADVNVKCPPEGTALRMATQKGRTELIQLLKKAGAKE